MIHDLALAESFAAEGRRFCDLLDSLGSSERAEFLREVQASLARLIALATTLPVIEPEDEEAVVGFMTHEEWHSLYERLQAFLGEVNGYWEVFNPYEQTEPIQASLADDLAGVYGDLRDGLDALEKGKAAEALWTWRFAFWSHWGAHAVGALRALVRAGAPEDDEWD